MEEFFTKVNFRKTHTNTHSFHSAMHDVILATFAQVGQVRILLDKLSRHVEEVQKRHVVILSNPNQEESESRTRCSREAGPEREFRENSESVTGVTCWPGIDR